MHDWINQVRLLVESSENAQVGIGASEQEVNEAETSLGVRFPSYFRAYLLEFGVLSVAHREFYGLGAGVPTYLHLVIETLAERHQFRPYIPKHLIPVENNGGGDHYCIDLSAELEDPPVVFWNHTQDESQVAQPEAECFSSWLLECIAENVA